MIQRLCQLAFPFSREVQNLWAHLAYPIIKRTGVIQTIWGIHFKEKMKEKE